MSLQNHQVVVGGPPGTARDGGKLPGAFVSGGCAPDEGVADCAPVRLHTWQVKLLQAGLNALSKVRLV